MKSFTYLVAAAGIWGSGVLAANFDVQIGPGNVYTPNRLANVAAGDTVTFAFGSGSHTVTQSTLAAPCERLANGFDSGV